MSFLFENIFSFKGIGLLAAYVGLVLLVRQVAQKFKGKALGRWAKWLLGKITLGVMKGE